MVYISINGHSSIHVVFLRNRPYLRHTVVTSFRIHFENIGHGLLREGTRREGEWAVWAKRKGMNRKYRSWKIKVNTAAMLVIKNKRSLADCVLFVLKIGVLHRITPATFLQFKIHLETARFEPRTFRVPV